MPQMQYIDYGLGVLRAAAISGWPENEAFDLADVYHRLAAEKQLAGYEVTQRFYELCSPEGLAALDTLLRHQPAFSAPPIIPHNFCKKLPKYLPYCIRLFATMPLIC